MQGPRILVTIGTGGQLSTWLSTQAPGRGRELPGGLLSTILALSSIRNHASYEIGNPKRSGVNFIPGF